jgi:hypothetical protein
MTKSSEAIARNLNLALIMLENGQDDIAFDLIIKTADVLKQAVQPATKDKGVK